MPLGVSLVPFKLSEMTGTDRNIAARVLRRCYADHCAPDWLDVFAEEFMTDDARQARRLDCREWSMSLAELRATYGPADGCLPVAAMTVESLEWGWFESCGSEYGARIEITYAANGWRALYGVRVDGTPVLFAD